MNINNMGCPTMFIFVYFSILMLTAGFVLTVCSWLAPPLNNFVYRVRTLGLLSLAIGSLMLGSSWVIGFHNKGRCIKIRQCCNGGVSDNERKMDKNYIGGSVIMVNPDARMCDKSIEFSKVFEQRDSVEEVLLVTQV